MSQNTPIYVYSYYLEEIGEDGPREVCHYGIESRTEAGRVFAYLGFSTRSWGKAERVAASMQRRASDDWTPERNPYWAFVRNAHGYPAGQLQEK